MCWSTTKFIRAAIAALWLAVACGCGVGGAEPKSRPSSESPQLRIVSFSPAISRTVVDLGLKEHVVGRTPFCEAIDSSVPIVGDLGSVDFEQLVRLEPTHVLVQPPASGLNPDLVDLAKQRGWVLGSWRLNGVEDVETIVRELPETLSLQDVALRDRLAVRAAEILNEIALAVAPGAEPIWRGRVLMLSQVDPPLAFGTGTYLHDILLALGSANAVTGAGWVQLSMEDAVRLQPDAIVLVKPGAVAASSRSDALAQLGPLGKSDMPAVREQRVAILVDRDALLPSSAVVHVASELRSALRDLAKAPQP
jgi:ABC-type hemin transport system substrate-binding protein